MTQCLRLFSVGCNINDSASSDSAVQIGQLDERLAEVAKQKNDEIEQYLARCKKSERKLVKVLLLGATASGKSTFMKQMRYVCIVSEIFNLFVTYAICIRVVETTILISASLLHYWIIYKDGYKRVEELQYFTDLITANIYWAFRQLVCGCVALSIDTTSIDELIVELMRRFGSYNVKETPGIRISRSTAQLLHAFWISEPVQKAYRKRYMFELIDSTNYFLNRLERISAPDFIADESDILHCRVPATATVGTSFRYGDVNLRIINIGGQKSQCRKWMHLFDDVRVVLFIVDLTAYARKCVDDKTRQELHGVLKQFREVARSNTLWRAFMLLFFNKADLFVELLDLVPLSDCFPRYSGESSVATCRECVRSVFMKAAEPRSSIVTHFTIATRTNNIGFAFSSCMDLVLKHALSGRSLL